MTGAATRFCRLETLSSLHDGYRRVFRVSGRELLLLQVDGEHFLIENRCPHQGFPLLDASRQGSTIRCSRHGFSFDLVSGACVGDSSKCGRLVRYQPVYEGNAIGVLSSSADEETCFG